MAPYHYWIGNKTGLILSSSKECPILKPIERIKYLGYTEDVTWPKKMNTGRIIYKPTKKAIRRQKKLRKRLKN